MTGLLCEMNVYQQSFISFFVIATIVGFILIFVDKKRWKEHTERSAEMMKIKSKSAVAVTETPTENESSTDEGTEKKKKKGKEKKPEPYEYEGRIKDRVLFTLAIVLCCGFGELLGMTFCRHKWYKPEFKIGMPIIALFNIGFIVLMIFACAEVGGDGIFKWTA